MNQVLSTRYGCLATVRFRVVLLAMLAGCGTYATAQQPAPHRQNSPGNPAGGGKSAYSTAQNVLASGQRLFESHCSSCHNFLQKGIGPGLGQVTTEVSPEWLKEFIRDAPGRIGRGDARAIRLFSEYKQYMPAFATLKEADLDALLAYLRANRRRALPTARGEDPGVAVNDPISAKIAKSGLRLRLGEVLTAPATAPEAPLARLNKMAVLPGQTERVFIEDLRGVLYELTNDSLRVFMSLPRVRPAFIHAPGLGSGFGSFAFHPEFHKNGLFYTTHTEEAGTAPADFAYADSIRVALQWVLTEWKMTDPAGAAFAGVGRELLRINMVTPMHGVQEITFNPLARPGSPDYGLLYMGVGDGGATENGYPFLCQDPSRIWGSVVRLDPLGTNSRNGRYGIPPTNPYAQAAASAALGEGFCRGFRNPNRLSWTPDGRLLITDIGQAHLEELNLGVAGAHYGWPEREGTFRINPRGDMGRVYPLPPGDTAFHYVYPVAQYDHDEGNAISGGFVYTGTALPLLRGKYLFGDVVNGRVFYVETRELTLGRQAVVRELELEFAGEVTSFRERNGGKKTDLRIGLGLNQELMLFTKSAGKLYRLTACTLAK